MNGESGATSEDNALSQEPKLFQHCVRLYERMEQEARDATDGKLYFGSLSNLLIDIGVSPSYQSKIVGRLRRMQCVQMRKRGGGGNSQSVWVLLKPPTIEDFHDSDDTGDTRYIHEAEKFDANTQRIMDLTRRIDRIEELLEEKGMAV